MRRLRKMVAGPLPLIYLAFISAVLWLIFRSGLLLPELLASIGLAAVVFVALGQQIHLWKLESIGTQTAETAKTTVTIATQTMDIATASQTIVTETREIADRSKTIAEQTVEITKSIRTQAQLQENIRRFFGVSEGDGKRYECIFPIEYAAPRPLFLINGGDFRAVDILISLLGQSRLELKPLLRTKVATVGKPNAVFICAPDANPITKDRFHLKGVMPCRINIDGEKSLTVEELPGMEATLHSPSEESYRRAREIYEKASQSAADPQEALHGEFGTARLRDYGILARKGNDDGGRDILIAGVHQQGTWIAADFLARLLQGQLVDTVTSVLLADEDFAVVVEATLVVSNLAVDDLKIAHWWQKRGGQWGKGPDLVTKP